MSLRFYLRNLWSAALDVARVLVGGPSCKCGETAWTSKRAVASGWKWGTYYDGDAGWQCPECQRAGADPKEW